MTRANMNCGKSVALLAALLLLAYRTANAFSTPISLNPIERVRKIELAAVSLPLVDTHAHGSTVGSWRSRQSRIDSILEHARHHQQKRQGQKVVARPQQTHAADASTSTRTLITPLPFTLPTLTLEQQKALTLNGEIVMHQKEMGRQGSGFVVQDIAADQETVWNALLDFERYTERIHTVRASWIQGGNAASFGVPSTTRASFEVSKFRLNISCTLQYKPEDNYLELSLDNSLQNSALQHAKGFWYVQAVDANTTRVWLLCDLTLSPLLPKFVVDTAAASAMPRASTWLRPAVQALQQQKQRVLSP